MSVDRLWECICGGPRRLRRVVALVLWIGGVGAVAASSVGAQAPPERYEYRQTRMGMAVRVVLYAPNDSTARRAGHAAFRKMAALEAVLSSYRDSSELNRLSRRAGTGPVPVSEPLFAVLRHAQQLARRSDGAFDATAGPLLALWSDARRRGALPDSSALRRAAARVGWHRVELDERRRTARLQTEGMQLNIGGIAKGFILDRALDTLATEGISRALIEAGGDLVMSGPPPGTEGWAVQLPAAGPEGGTRTVRLRHAAVATSGDTEQFVEIDGTRYSHVVDPRTGIGLTHRLLVTVVAGRGVVADGLATTVGVLGRQDGRAFLEAHYPSVTAYLRRADRDGGTTD